MDFEIKKWIEEHELKEDTVKLLQDRGFDSYRSLSLLSEDTMKKELSKLITPGQLALLREAVSILRPPPPTPATTSQPPAASQQETQQQPTTQPPPSQGLSTPPAAAAAADPSLTADMLATWSAVLGLQQPGLQQPAATNITQPTDPFGFGQGSNSGKKHRKLVDYISHHHYVDPTYEEGATVSIGGVEFAVAKGKRIPKDKVRVAQYMEGSLRILREMITEDGASINQITDYVNYLIQIACFTQSMKWQSVLNYDAIYRREQHANGFTWGTSSPFLMQSQLMTLEQPATTNRINKRPFEAVHNPKTGRQVCGSFNSIQGCQLTDCRFDHVCKTCFANHPRHQHEQPQITPKN